MQCANNRTEPNYLRCTIVFRVCERSHAYGGGMTLTCTVYTYFVKEKECHTYVQSCRGPFSFEPGAAIATQQAREPATLYDLYSWHGHRLVRIVQPSVRDFLTNRSNRLVACVVQSRPTGPDKQSAIIVYCSFIADHLTQVAAA